LGPSITFDETTVTGDETDRDFRLQATLKTVQNPSGGFGGGQGQYAHTATTYASVLALITTGGPSACEMIDRRAMSVNGDHSDTGQN